MVHHSFLRVVIAMSVILVTGCAFDAATSSEPNPIAGSWRFDAVQEAPVLSTVAGRAEVEGALSDDVRITVTGIERAQGDVDDAIVIIGTGRVVGAVFDVTMQWYSGPRRFVGTVAGDSITGVWTGSTPPLASGRFRMKRDP